jgi:hypothetical protein
VDAVFNFPLIEFENGREDGADGRTEQRASSHEWRTDGEARQKKQAGPRVALEHDLANAAKDRFTPDEQKRNLLFCHSSLSFFLGAM